MRGVYYHGKIPRPKMFETHGNQVNSKSFLCPPRQTNKQMSTERENKNFHDN